MAKGKRKLSDTLNKKTSTNVNLTNKLCQIETEKKLNKLTEEINDIRNKALLLPVFEQAFLFILVYNLFSRFCNFVRVNISFQT